MIPLPSAEDARKVFYARQIIEGQTAAAAARHAGPDEVAALERVLGEQDHSLKVGNKEEFSDNQRGLPLGHRPDVPEPLLPSATAGTPSGARTPTSSSSTLSTQDLQRSAPVSRTAVYHQKILEAIARHDPQEAAKMMEQHVIVTYEGLAHAPQVSGPGGLRDPPRIRQPTIH